MARFLIDSSFFNVWFFDVFKVVNVVVVIKFLKLFDSYVWDCLAISIDLKSYYVRLYRNFRKMVFLSAYYYIILVLY